MTNQTEMKIARFLVEKGLEGGNYALVHYYGEDESDKLTKLNDVIEEARATEMSWVSFHEPEGKRLGAFMLIWGNGEDLISDYTANEWSEKLFNEMASSLGLIQ